MGIADQVAPIKIGVLIDFVLPAPSAWNIRDDFLEATRLTLDDAVAAGRLDRPVELVIRECEGLPRGTVKAVIDAYGELVDEGCLGVFGPMISESAVPLREAIEDRFKVPAISWCGADEWHGEWTFSLGNGSLTDEPYVIASILRQRGLATVAVSHERSLIGQKYLSSFRDGVPGRRRQHRVRGGDRAERRRRDGGRRRDAHERARRDRALGVRPGRGGGERRAGRARLGPAAVHGDVVGERLHERRDLPCPPRLDRPRAVRREQRGGAALPRPLRRGPRSPTRIHHADLRPRRRPGVRRRARAGRTALAPGRDGGARAGEDAPGGVRGAGHPDLVRQVDPTGLDGRRLPGGERGDARLREHGAPGRLA